VPLISTGAEPVRSADLFGWSVQMTDGTKNYRVLVSDEALQDLAHPPDSGLDRLDAYRDVIEAAASAKLAAGIMEADGTIRVTSADVENGRLPDVNKPRLGSRNFVPFCAHFVPRNFWDEFVIADGLGITH
jgi:hypothetical protein